MSPDSDSLISLVIAFKVSTILALVKKYIETKKQIAEMSRTEISNNRNEIIRDAVTNVAKPSSSPEKSYVEKMAVVSEGKKL